ncbi:MAG: outer membrane beta-barrel protein [bacterium]
MKKSISYLTILFVIALSTGTFAQGKQYEFAVGGGISVPLGPDEFKDFWNLGFNGNAGIGYFITPQLTIGGNFTFNRFSLDGDKMIEDLGGAGLGISVDGGAISAFEILGVGKYYFSPIGNVTNFYVLGGVGLGIVKVSEATISAPGIPTETVQSDSESKLLVAGGLGVTFPVGATTNIFVEGRFSLISTEGSNTTFLPVRAGIIF